MSMCCVSRNIETPLAIYSDNIMPHILMVEDDLTYATMMQTWLCKKGFEVDRCSSAGAAARLLTDAQLRTAIREVMQDLRAILRQVEENFSTLR